MVRAWLVSDAAARRWVDGLADDADLLPARPVPGEEYTLFVEYVAGRKELVRVLRMCLREGWGLLCLDRENHYARWRWEITNGPARYVSPQMMRREGPGQRWAQGISYPRRGSR